MGRKATLAFSGATTVIPLALTASPAQAVPVYNAACSTTGASGNVSISDWHQPTATVGVVFSLTDTKADGHHARIRILSKRYDGSVKRWRWRKNVDGAGETNYWGSSASDDNGLFEIGVQVARFEGDTLLNSCTHWI